jgi:uncharacterized protein YhhL (DUF1145 family)
MNLKQINTAKKFMLFYWASVIITALFFRETTFAYYHILIAAIMFVAHIGETFIFNGVYQKYSDNIGRDKLLNLVYGILIPTELKLKNKKKANHER